MSPPSSVIWPISMPRRSPRLLGERHLLASLPSSSTSVAGRPLVSEDASAVAAGERRDQCRPQRPTVANPRVRLHLAVPPMTLPCAACSGPVGLGASSTAWARDQSRSARGRPRCAAPNRRYSAGTTNRLNAVDGDEPAEDDGGHRVHDLVAGAAAEEQQRQEGRDRCHGASSPSAPAARGRPGATSSGPKALAVAVLELRGSAGRTARCGARRGRTPRGSPASVPIESTSPSMSAATTPPASAPGSATNSTAASRQLPNAACRSRKMPTAQRPADADERQPRRLPVVVVAEQLGVVLERELRCSRMLSSMSLGHRVDVAPARRRRRRRCSATRPRAGSRSGSASRCTSATSSRRTWPPPSGRSIEQLADVVEAVAASRACPRPPPRRSSAPRTGCRPRCRQHRRRRPPDVAGLDAERLRLVEVDLDLAASAPSPELDVGVLDAVDPRHRFARPRRPWRRSSSRSCSRRRARSGPCPRRRPASSGRRRCAPSGR